MGPGPHIPPAPLPANYFTRRVDPRNSNQWIDSPYVESAVLKNKFAYIAKLQDKAFEQSCCHWVFLENADKPEAWVKRALGQRHSRTANQDITFPEPQDIPDLALRWIKECVREAARKREPTPVLATLPAHAQGWVSDCIAQGVKLAQLDAVQKARKEAEDRACEDAEEKARQARGEGSMTDHENVQNAFDYGDNNLEKVHQQLILPTSHWQYGTTFTGAAETNQASGEENEITLQKDLTPHRLLCPARPPLYPELQGGITPSQTALGKRKRSDEDLDTVCMHCYELAYPCLHGSRGSQAASV